MKFFTGKTHLYENSSTRVGIYIYLHVIIAHYEARVRNFYTQVTCKDHFLRKTVYFDAINVEFI